MDASSTIRSTRERAGLTQAELAERSGTSQATLSAYENGRKVPSAQTLDRILLAGGARLATVEARPVRTPGRARLGDLSHVLARVLELAEALPTKHQPELTYPRLPGGSRASR